MSEAAPLSTGDALEALVHQFADPLAFLRELVQNAIDAGSAEIDVSVEYHDDVLEIRVDDYGDGMDRHIIDTRLTRLFSSSKEGDQTKIGRFGIGFVSVFALAPDAVVVDTARGGECWRVLFRSDRTFERIVLHAPVDGTKIRILKRTDRALFDEVRRRAPEVLARYCRHAEAEIRFHGTAINEPFDLASPCKLVNREEGSEIVVGYAEGVPTAGYYNRGLTLLEGELAGKLYSFKINSHHLEHTLTRDNVLRDEKYDALLARVRELGERVLPALLFERIERALGRADASAELETLYALAARQLSAWRGAAGADLAPIEGRRIARVLGGEPASLRTLAELTRAGGRLYVAAEANPISEALAARGELTLDCAPSSRLTDVLRALGGEPVAAGAVFCCALPARAAPAPGGERLASATERLLRASECAVQRVRFGRLDHPGSTVGDRVAVLLREGSRLTERAVACRSPFDADAPCELVLNEAHPTTRKLVLLAECEPELAAHLACKLLLVGQGLTILRDGRLAQLALEARWQRSIA